MIWNMLVQCKGVEDQAAIKETVESLIPRVDCPIIQGSSHVSSSWRSCQRVERTLWCQSNCAGATKIRLGVCWHGGERHQTGERESKNTCERELHGVVMGPEHVAVAWCVRFAGQIVSRTVKDRDGITAFHRRRRHRIRSESMSASSGASKTDPRSSLLEHHLVVWCAELSNEGLVRMPLTQCNFNGLRGTPRNIVPGAEILREPREPMLEIDVRLVKR